MGHHQGESADRAEAGGNRPGEEGLMGQEGRGRSEGLQVSVVSRIVLGS